MKRISSFLIMFFVFCACHMAQKRHALLVGISNYNDEAWNLNYARKDMVEMDRLLKKFGYTTTNLYDQSATKQHILEKIQEITQDTIARQLFLFYAGHGAEGCILAADKQGVSYEEIVNAFSSSPLREVFCFIDACYSGSSMNLSWHDSSWARGKKVNFCISCRGNESAAEDVWLGNGYFSFALRKGFRSGADLNQDKEITFDEICNYVHKDVKERTKGNQHPQMIANKKSKRSVIVNMK